MRKRTFGRWATRLALVAALGVGGFVASAWLSSASSGNVLADLNWNVCSVSSSLGETPS
jgi:hypothetical protein